METLLRESSFGRCLNYLTQDRCFPYPEIDMKEWEKPSSSNFTDDERIFQSDLVDKHFVDFSGPEDPDIPKNWSRLVKTIVMLDIMLLNFSFYAASAIFTPSIQGIEKSFNATTAEGTLGLSLFVIAYGIGPLILSPLSNIPSIGRTTVYLFGCTTFCLFNIGIALSKNMQTILILRFFGGLFGSAPISLGGTTLIEVYDSDEVPYVIALYAVSGVCGPILGPFLGTIVLERWKMWSASLWLITGINAFTTIFVFFFLPETLSSNILRRRARRVRAATGNPSAQTQFEMTGPKTSFVLALIRQIVHDFKLSCIDPVLLSVNLHTMLIYGILYLWFEFFPFVFGGIYHFSAIQQAIAFFGILVGAIISVTVYVFWLYFSYQPKLRDPNVCLEPEARLVPGKIGAVCIPICLFIFAWSSRATTPWIIPVIGTAFFAPGFYLTFQSILNYLGESYPRYLAGVFAGNTFFRSSFGGALPLAAPRMLDSLGIGWACSVLGFISVAMVPLPFILERYGKRLRSWSPYAN